MKSSRLLTLLLLLQTRQRMTTSELAARLEVSRRTVLRDIEALSAAGVPVYAERGRSGGVVLLPGARLNLSHLEPAELESLSLAGLDIAQREQLGLAEAHGMAARKIAARQAALPGPDPGLADLIVIDNTAWLAPESRGAQVADLALDLRARRRLRIRYRRSGETQPSARVVDPYGLAAKSGRWYLVADHHRSGRLYNLERLEGYEVLPEAAQIRPGRDLRAAWAELSRQVEEPGQLAITVRLQESRLDLARRILGPRLAEVGPPDQGWCAATVRFPGMESVRQLLQFADNIEVIAPAQARQRIHDLAADLAHRHAATTS